jgi:SOS-response transcriptional repressor LexA
MTPRQRDALAYIVAYQQQHGGVSPTYRQIQRALRAKAPSCAFRVVHALKDAGHIRILPGRARSIEVLSLRQPEREFLAAADAAAREMTKTRGHLSVEVAEESARQTDIEDRTGRKVA